MYDLLLGFFQGDARVMNKTFNSTLP